MIDTAPLKSRRLTIGLLMDWAESTYQVKIWSGVEDGAKERDISLICYVSGALASAISPKKQHDRFFKLINKDNIDGLIVLSATFTHFIDQKTLYGVLKQFDPIPIVSIATPMPCIPSILIDNAQGMTELLCHLIDTHGYSRIAYLAGARGHSDAQERLASYKETLTSRGIPYDQSLVVQGDFSMLSGQSAMYELLDNRKAEIDAVVAANDQMAIGALAALAERGINVPGDIAVTGFDDIGMYKTVIPPLTTIRQPLYKQGKRSLEILIDMIERRRVPEREIIPTTLILRESCGCFSRSTKDIHIRNFTSSASANWSATNEDKLQVVFSEIKKMLAPYIDRMNPAGKKAMYERMEQLYNAFITELMFEESGTFLYLWSETMSEAVSGGSEISLLRTMLSAFHRYIGVLSYTGFAEQKAELLIKQARRLIIEREKRIKEHKQVEMTNEIFTVRELGEELIITADLDELRKLLAEVLPQFGIKCCYLSLYGETGDGERFSQLILAFNEKGIIPITGNVERFAETKLVPDGLFPSHRRYSMMVDTLYHTDEQLGFGVLELGPQEGIAYDILRRRLRNAVKGALLLQQVEDQTIALESANKKLQEEIKNRRRIEKEILEVSGREQKRIGQDLHDDLGQKLTGIAFMARVLEEKLDKKSMEEAKDAAEITRLIDESIAQSKRLARGLMPVELEEDGLAHALSELAAKIESSSGISCSFSSPSEVLINDSSSALHLFRIAQEAVNNAAKHSSCHSIAIELSARDGILQLLVKDDGVGFPQDVKQKKGIGLHIMSYRANIMDGTILIRKNEPFGTIVECMIPFFKKGKKPGRMRTKEKETAD